MGNGIIDYDISFNKFYNNQLGFDHKIKCLERGIEGMEMKFISSTEEYQKELSYAALPLLEFLNKNGNMHQHIIVSQDGVKMVNEEVGIPSLLINDKVKLKKINITY